MPTGWVTIQNLTIAGQVVVPPYTVMIASGQQFYIDYDVVVSSSVPGVQIGWGEIVNTVTMIPITEANSEWTNTNMTTGTYHIQINVPAGAVTVTKNWALRVGHIEYNLVAQSNNTGWGTVAIQSPAATYYPNQVVTLLATPIGTATFLNWTRQGTIIGTSTTLVYPMGAADTTIIGNFQSAGVPTCDAGGPYAAQVNQSIQFNGSASGGTAPYSFVWDFGDGQYAYIEDPTHSYTTTGTKTVTLTITDAASQTCSDSASAVISGAGCTTGETQCIDGIKWVCINGVWQQTTQPCCNLNDIKCQNEQVFICDTNNNWVPSGVICCVPNADKCIDGVWNTCNPTGDGWIPSEYPCQQNIPIEYIIIGGVAVVGGLIAIAAATGGLGGYAIGRRRR